jgi:glutamate synthase (NADPH/NADH) small chain
MDHSKGFLKYDREEPRKKPVKERIKDYSEFYEACPESTSQEQAARCMECGIPFCHNGCPLGNQIPDFNGAVYAGNWEEAHRILKSTNNFPEFTGRICPAPCESSCVLAINKPAVTIEQIEKEIAEQAFKKGFEEVEEPQERTGKQVAVIGSGPAGLAAAAQLNQAGHTVAVYEREDRIGGLLRYGIPDFKLEHRVVDRRIELMQKEGIEFYTNANVGINLSAKELHEQNDAIVLGTGCTVPRNLPIQGREVRGVHFAMDFLVQQNKRNAGDTFPEAETISAEGKDVVVIGGGDTGSDCVGTSNRQGAKSITLIELTEQPPNERPEDNPWPQWPMTLKTSASHEEGVERRWSILTKAFISDGKGNLAGLKIVDLEWHIPENGGNPYFTEKEDTERIMNCDLCLLAMGFTQPEPGSVLWELDVASNENDLVATTKYRTNVQGVFASGDMRMGQSLVVWAISEGREAAREVDRYLMGDTILPSKDVSYVEMEG